MQIVTILLSKKYQLTTLAKETYSLSILSEDKISRKSLVLPGFLSRYKGVSPSPSCPL